MHIIDELSTMTTTDPQRRSTRILYPPIEPYA